jgi:hypothetical protein
MFFLQSGAIRMMRVVFGVVSMSWFLFNTFGQTGWSQPQAIGTLSTPEEFKQEFQSVPCKNSDRLEAVKSLFQKMGATESEIVKTSYKHVDNIAIRKAGVADGTIVVGAHYDKVNDGCGALDNWTGVVAVAHLFRSLKNAPLKRSVLFVGFGKEEEGLIGSHAMADALKKEDLLDYCAMINIDSLGLSAPQIMDNTSTPNLEALTEQIAKEMKIPFAHARISNGDADSSSFLQKRIPAVTIHGMTNDWPKILHSNADQGSKVNPDSVYLGYRLTLALLSRLDAAPCDAYKK